MMGIRNRFRGALVGLAMGDAVGTTVEFKKRGTFPPLTDMVGGGPFNLKAGQWTDDTSMALCLAQSLIQKKTFDPRDQMNRYVNWYHHGYMSSTSECFDIGFTTRQALEDFISSGKPFSGSRHPQSAGNGSLMRLAPVPLAYYGNMRQATFYSGESSRTTHGAQECIDACYLFGRIIYRAVGGMSKKDILLSDQNEFIASESVSRVAKGLYVNNTVDYIQGTGYSIESLKAALWCFYHSNSFEEAILKAANLGDDADTTAAICGQVAGAYYGYEDLPSRWKEKLHMHDEIVQMADALYDTEMVM